MALFATSRAFGASIVCREMPAASRWTWSSSILQRFPDIELGKRNKVGIWGKLTKLDTPLREHDRVEIYRPLIADPKEVRKQRAAEGKRMKKGGGKAEEGAAGKAGS